MCGGIFLTTLRIVPTRGEGDASQLLDNFNQWEERRTIGFRIVPTNGRRGGQSPFYSLSIFVHP
jgi:hypothetical protein